jgi:diguanylate cyclase (GGDEF)-like protein
LTGLASRTLFLERLRHRLARARRGQTRPAVLFIDLDRFKLINDSQGHAAGDALLIGVADRIRACLGSTDTAARLGGDEFAVITQDGGARRDAAGLAARIIAGIQAPFLIQGMEAFVSASVGIAYNTDPDQLDEDLIRCADLAMYQAKKQGPGRFEVFHPAMQARLLRTRDLEVRMRRAVEQDEFVLHYQPIVDLADGRIRAVEALLRWEQPDLGRIPPQQFIPLAEENGLIVPIGRWALREACRQVSEWNTALRAGSPLAVNVNLSARQLQQADLPDTLSDILRETGLAPQSLVLEMTESHLLMDTESTMTRLAGIKALNVNLALDDFGTGYSSLAYLRRFPIDMIKIDKSFVAGIGHGSERSTLTRAIVQLGQTLQLITVAEGIETTGQMLELRNAGCLLGQGYHFAKPADPREMAGLLVRAE